MCRPQLPVESGLPHAQSRRCQQRAQRKERGLREARQLAQGLDKLSGSKLVLNAADRLALKEQVDSLHQELRSEAASDCHGWQALARLSRVSPGYGATESTGGPPRGALVRAEIENIDLPSQAGIFPAEQGVSRLADWADWMLRPEGELNEADLDSIRAYADPALRGRRRGFGDGLERLVVRMVKARLVVPTKRASGARGIKLMTVSKGKKRRQRLVWDMRQTNSAFKPPPAGQARLSGCDGISRIRRARFLFGSRDRRP